MLDFEYTCSQRGWRVMLQYRHRSLDDDRTVIQIRGDKVHGTAVNSDTILQCAFMRIHPGIGRQE